MISKEVEIMNLKTPTMFNRPMKKVKEYKHFILFEDEKTKIKECFQIWDLTHKNNRNSNDNILTKQNIKSDNRLITLIKEKFEKSG